MQTNQLKALLTNAIDTARADLWETNISKRSEKGTEELLREVMHLFNSEVTDRIQTENDNAN